MSWLIALLSFGLHAAVSELCAERLWRQVCAMPTVDELRERLDDDPAAALDLLRRDATLLEIAFLKPGAVDPDLFAHPAFRMFKEAHEVFGRRMARVRAREVDFREPSWIERASGRAEFRSAVRAMNEAILARRAVRSFWTEWGLRVPELRKIGLLRSRLDDVERDLLNRANRLARQSWWAERRDQAFVDLLEFIERDGRLSRAETAAYMLPYLRREYELCAARFDRLHHAFEAQRRRRAFRLLGGEGDP